MAAIATGGSGNWSSTSSNAPWSGGVVPVEGDTVTIASGHTVTIDQNVTVGADSATAAIAISSGGKLQVLSSAAAAYTLRLKGDLSITGTAEFGTSGNPIPTNRLFTVKTNYSAAAADGKYGITINSGGVLRAYGASKTNLKTVLTADKAAAATTLAVTSTTGWATSDVLAIASTTRTPGDSESKTILTVDSSTGVTLTAGLTNAHSGTSPTQAEVINLTQSVVITSDATSTAGWIQVAAGGSFDWRNVEFSYLGANTTNKRGIEIQTTTASTMQDCSLHDFRNWGIVFGSGNPNNITITNVVGYNLNTQVAASTRGFSFESATTGTANVINGLYLIAVQTPTSGTAANIADVGGTISNLLVAGSCTGTSSVAIDINENAVINSFSSSIAHSNAGLGFRQNQSGTSGTVTSLTGWRNADRGFQFSGGVETFTLDTGTFFGNAGSNIKSGQQQNFVEMKNLTVDGDSSFTTPIGFESTTSFRGVIVDSTFGATTTHTSKDIQLNNQTNTELEIYNTTLNSSTQVGFNSASLTFGIRARIHRLGQTALEKCFYGYGTITSDTTTRHTGSGLSWKLTPTSATFKLNFPGPTPYDTFKAVVNSGSLVTITAYVQKDASYNGTAARLVLKGGTIQGISADVTASMTVASGNWEQLTVTGTPTENGTIQYYFDCNGTAGNIFVDDVSVTQA